MRATESLSLLPCGLHVDGEGRVQKVDRHEMLINPGIPIPREVVKLTGITDGASG